MALSLVTGCHDASQNRPQTDQGSELIQALTTNPTFEPTFEKTLAKISPTSSRAKTIFGEALGVLADNLDASLKENVKKMKVEWQYIEPKETHCSLVFSTTDNTLVFKDASGTITIEKVTAPLIKGLAANAKLGAQPDMFKTYGCLISSGQSSTNSN